MRRAIARASNVAAPMGAAARHKGKKVKKRFRNIVFLCAFAWLVAAMGGCSMQKMVGKNVIEYSHDEAIPYLMSQGDLASACQMGQAMGPVLMTFERVGLDPSQVGIGTYMASGMCAEMAQREHELARYRALGEQRAAEAQDALVREKQAHSLAASRMILAYESAVASYGDLSEKCPEYDGETDELLSLLGLASGALAILHDFNSEKAVGISLDIPGKIEKGAQCFDDDKWWGMPTALRAAIWLSIPGSGPQDVDPLDALEKAAKRGEEQGVLLARAMQVMMLATVGQTEKMCESMAEINRQEENGEYAMLNAYARGMIQHQADIAWTKAKGHRAPLNWAQCPIDSSASTMDAERADDLLEGLFEDEEVGEAEIQEANSESTTGSDVGTSSSEASESGSDVGTSSSSKGSESGSDVVTSSSKGSESGSDVVTSSSKGSESGSDVGTSSSKGSESGLDVGTSSSKGSESGSDVGTSSSKASESMPR